jgi:hypothetical protein
MEIPGYKAPFTPQEAASRMYPLQFLCDLAYAILDNEMGDHLKYPHLLKHPKHKDVWTKSFRKKIVHLATTTESLFFINKNNFPEKANAATSIMAELYACTVTEWKTNFACAS